MGVCFAGLRNPVVNCSVGFREPMETVFDFDGNPREILAFVEN